MNREEVAGRVKKRILAHILDSSKIQFLHIKRHNNQEAYRLDKIGSRLKDRELVIDNYIKTIKWSPYFLA